MLTHYYVMGAGWRKEAKHDCRHGLMGGLGALPSLAWEEIHLFRKTFVQRQWIACKNLEKGGQTDSQCLILAELSFLVLTGGPTR